MKLFPWRGGNRLKLLENGEAYYAAVFDAIIAADQEILIETYILVEDKVGTAMQQHLIAAAAKGLRVELTLDGFGSPDLSAEFIRALTEAGVRVRIYDPGSKVGLLRTNMFRRLHRKMVVIDNKLAFIGGINFSADHLADFGPLAKQDYAARVEGPVVADMRQFFLAWIQAYRERKKTAWWRYDRMIRQSIQPAGDSTIAGAQVLFSIRDNGRHRKDIERQYRLAVRTAHTDIIIASAYFFPGYRLYRDLCRAVRRGVRVRLLLQGVPDIPLARTVTRMLYQHLLRSGVGILEFTKQPFHGKVAVVDDYWSTIGSSNLDPTSLSLNLEANLVVRDHDFNQGLRLSLEDLIRQHSIAINAEEIRRRLPWRLLPNFVSYFLLRYLPTLSAWLPSRAPQLIEANPETEHKN